MNISDTVLSYDVNLSTASLVIMYSKEKYCGECDMNK